MSRTVRETELIRQRKPDSSERARGAEVVFERRAPGGREYTILASKCHESWEQWGAPTDVLGDNVEDVEAWRTTVR